MPRPAPHALQRHRRQFAINVRSVDRRPYQAASRPKSRCSRRPMRALTCTSQERTRPGVGRGGWKAERKEEQRSMHLAGAAPITGGLCGSGGRGKKLGASKWNDVSAGTRNALQRSIPVMQLGTSGRAASDTRFRGSFFCIFETMSPLERNSGVGTRDSVCPRPRNNVSAHNRHNAIGPGVIICKAAPSSSALKACTDSFQY